MGLIPWVLGNDGVPGPLLSLGRAGLLRPATPPASLLATMQTMAGVRTSFILERPGTGATEYFTHR